MKRVFFLILVASGVAGAWLWWQRRLDAQQQDVWTQVMTPEPEAPAPVTKAAGKKAPAKKAAGTKAAAKKAAAKKAP